ncbi:MAG: response regulator [Lachnospiraceae bacterium]|nr:response regulator [Lachnospiraceae bacterium]
MIFYYAITTILALTNLIVLVYTYENKKANYYFMLSIIVMALSNCGYLALALSTELNEAILANKIGYIGGCFIPLITLFLICTICNYSLPGWLRYILYGLSFGVYLMVLTIGYSDFYYKDLSLGKLGNATVLLHSYGVGHVLFYVILYGYLALEAILLAYHLIKRRAVSQSKLWLLSAMVIFNIVVFVGGRMINPDIEIMPLLYVIDGWVFIYLQGKNMIYNLEDSIASTIREQKVYGYILFDNCCRYMGCNKVARNVFPEIAECKVDYPINNVEKLGMVVSWLKVYIDDGKDNFDYQKDEKYYEIKVSRVWYRKKARGYVVEIKDDTARRKYMSLLSNYNDELKGKVNEQTAELMEQQNKIQELFLQTVSALSEAVDAKDRYTSGHSKRVAEYSRMIAERLGKSRREQEEIYRAGLLHDVGKIRIPVDIINKAGKLTDEEFNIIKVHPVTGYHILSGISGSEQIAIAAKYHHERYDGKGYPNGLEGERIPLVARILGVADSYDAMTSNRSYRDALPQDVVRSEILKGRGSQFDPEIADIMLDLIDKDTEYKMRQSDVDIKKILVVDDEPMNHKLLSHIMKDEPRYQIVSVYSGKEALKELQKQDFRLIMLDVMMPEMDGLETLRHIRKVYNLPVVLMTGDKTLDTSVGFAELGCDDYITKPFLPILIKEVLHNMTERTKVKN